VTKSAGNIEEYEKETLDQVHPEKNECKFAEFLPRRLYTS